LKERISKAIFDADPLEIKSFDDSENKKVIKEFCKEVLKDESDAYFYLKKTAGRDFVLTKEVSKAHMPQDKVMCVFKAGSEPLTRDNMDKTLMFNEMNRTNLDQMRRTLENVFIPAFTFTKEKSADESNLTNWSQKSREDMIDKLSSMSVETVAIEGQVQGNTELPLPIQS
jgi:hypothetical protein